MECGDILAFSSPCLADFSKIFILLILLGSLYFISTARDNVNWVTVSFNLQEQTNFSHFTHWLIWSSPDIFRWWTAYGVPWLVSTAHLYKPSWTLWRLLNLEHQCFSWLWPFRFSYFFTSVDQLLPSHHLLVLTLLFWTTWYCTLQIWDPAPRTSAPACLLAWGRQCWAQSQAWLVSTHWSRWWPSPQPRPGTNDLTSISD